MSKRKNYIDRESAKKYFNEHGYEIYELQDYVFRISHPLINNLFIDWYHTTGTMVKNKNGTASNFGSEEYPLEVVHKISKEFMIALAEQPELQQYFPQEE